MAVLDQPITTYSDTTPQKRTITDVISLIDPTDAPTIDALGGLDGASGKFRFVNEKGVVVEWLEDTHLTLSGSMAATAASTDTTLSVADASVFQAGHVVLLGSEYLWVSSVNVSGDVLTVTRAFGGTTAATAASNAALTILSMARLEGSESNVVALTDRTSSSNATQIFHQEVKVSRSQRQIAQYGIADEFAYQSNKAVPQLMRQIEKWLFYSAAAAAGSATTPRAMGGFRAFVTTNLLSGATLAQSQIENAVKSAYLGGGVGPWFAFMHPNNLQKIKNFYDATTTLRVERSETTVGMVITKIETISGTINLVQTRWAPTNYIHFIDPKHAGMKTFYPFTFEALAKTGDFERGEVVGEFTFCLRQNAAHAMLTNVS